MADSESQAPKTKSADIAEHREPEPQAVPPAPEQDGTEQPADGDAADQGGGRSLRKPKPARSVAAAPLGRASAGAAGSTRGSSPVRSLRDAVNAAESRAQRTFPGRAR